MHDAHDSSATTRRARAYLRDHPEVAEAVDKWPPLSPEQMARIRALIPPLQHFDSDDDATRPQPPPDDHGGEAA